MLPLLLLPPTLVVVARRCSRRSAGVVEITDGLCEGDDDGDLLAE